MNFADCACFVPEPGQNIHLPLSKKKQAAGDTVHSDGRLTYGFRCSPGPERNYNAKPLSRSIEEQWTRRNLFGAKFYARISRSFYKLIFGPFERAQFKHSSLKELLTFNTLDWDI